MTRSHRRGPRKPADELKDCLVQARVPRELQSALKDEAKRRRLSVSHLIRNVLEDTVQLVDNVVTEVDNLVSDSVGLAQQVTRDASNIAASAAALCDPLAKEDERPGGTASPEPEPEPDALEHVYAWNPVVLNRAAACARCAAELAKGQRGNLGLTQDPSAAPTWLCDGCVDSL
ncbi:MAG: hypothetical protein OXT09_35875 [Myxococcales bacterium]|nr:hypothetical protein [Myxococcales bacterium]